MDFHTSGVWCQSAGYGCYGCALEFCSVQKLAGHSGCACPVAQTIVSCRLRGATSWQGRKTSRSRRKQKPSEKRTFGEGRCQCGPLFHEISRAAGPPKQARVEKPAEVEESKSPPKSEHSAKGAANAGRFFMKFRGPQALPNRPQKTMACPTVRLILGGVRDRWPEAFGAGE